MIFLLKEPCFDKIAGHGTSMTQLRYKYQYRFVVVLREEHRLRVFLNRVLRRIIWTKER
jgi:hypothetical protein